MMEDSLDNMSETDSEPAFEDSNDLMAATMEDEVTAQLAAAGPVGMAAAAAIASAKKRKRPHQFETNPSIRKRQQTRLLRKLRQTIDEFTVRVGMQAVILVAIPGKPQNSYKCFGAKPLEDVIRNLRPVVMQDLESALAQHAPVPAPEDPSLHELPPLVIDGIPTPVEKMTQAQLRAFIPLMLKYSTGRGKPGWGKESTRPGWWPEDLPWANVRMDARTEDEKQKVSWTHALRQIVINCYEFHGRKDLLPVFSGDHSQDEDVKPHVPKKASHNHVHHLHSQLTQSSQQQQAQAQQAIVQAIAQQQPSQGSFGPTVLQTISNADGTVSIIQVDPTNSIITLPDGTTAQVQGVATLQQDSSTSGGLLDMSQPNQLIITGEDGQAYPVTVSGMITMPVGHSMYQTVVGQMMQHNDQQQRRGGGRGRTRKSQILPLVMPKLEPGLDSSSETQVSSQITCTQIPVSALTGDLSQTQLVTVNAQGQVIHGDKVYQICEFFKEDNGQQQNEGDDGLGEKVVMMEQSDDGPEEVVVQEECVET